MVKEKGRTQPRGNASSKVWGVSNPGRTGNQCGPNIGKGEMTKVGKVKPGNNGGNKGTA